jgi:hypothetical protein
MYRITMVRTTSGEVIVEREISGYTRAYTLFVGVCDDHGYEMRENPMEGGYIAGGHGFDYIIELQEVDPDDREQATQYKPF